MGLDDHGSPPGSRRRFLAGASAAVAALPLCGRWPQEPAGGTDDAHDEALAMLVGHGPEYGDGLSNHGPMALEALAQLQRLDAARAWVERYRRRLEPAPTPGRVLAARDRDAALGRRDAFADWEATFAARLQEQAWRDVVADEAPRLVPGMVGALAHGVIRTAHAARALAAKETPLRRQELARALAYWASNCRPLLGDPGAGDGGPLAGLAAVPLLPQAGRRLARGASDRRIAEATTFAPFVDAARRTGPGPHPAAFLAELLRTTARQFVQHGAAAPIMFCHAFTAAAAVQALWPFLGEATRRQACQHAWQLVAAIQARFAAAPFTVVAAEPADWREDLADAAVADGDDHVVKLTAACAVAWRADPAPELVAAARRARELL